MQSNDAAYLRKKWENKPCSHPSFDKEYILGGQTGDYVCETCGETFMESQYRKIKEERDKAAETPPGQV